MVALVLFCALLALRLVAELRLQPPRVDRPPSGERHGQVSLAVLVVAYAVAVGATGWGLYRDAARLGIGEAAGLLVVAVAGLGRVWAARELGRSYTPWITQRPGGGLVTTGPYALVRHPLYLLYLIEVCGFVLVCPAAVTWVCLGAILVAVLVRVRAEDRLLAAVHGQAFAAYQARTAALVPFVF